MSIKIDEEFRSLIPPLSKEEYTQLEQNILKDGIRDPLVVWKTPSGDEILVDGHNRKRIADAHPGITYKVEYMEFDLRKDAIQWIILNQFGRRNISAYDRSVLALKLKPLIAEKAKKQQANHSEQGYQKSDKAVHTAKELAKTAGVSHDTIHKVEVIEAEASEQTKQQVRSGEKSINQAYNEIRNREIRRLPTAKEYADQAKERHEDFQKQPVVSVTDIRNDQRDRQIIEGEVIRKIKKTFSAISDLYILIDAGEVPVSVLSDEGKRIAIRTLTEMQNCIDMIGKIIGKR